MNRRGCIYKSRRKQFQIQRKFDNVLLVGEAASLENVVDSDAAHLPILNQLP